MSYILLSDRIRSFIKGATVVILCTVIAGTGLIYALGSSRVSAAAPAITFNAAQDYRSQSLINWSAVGSVRAGDRGDVVTANIDGTISVWLNDGNGHFAAQPLPPTIVDPNNSVNSITLGDANKDGKTDIIAVTSDPTGAHGIAVLLGNGDGTFKAPIFTATTISYLSVQNTPSAVAVGDFNGDGRLDVAVGFNPSELGVFFGDGVGHFVLNDTRGVDTQHSWIKQIMAVDLVGNGLLDLVLVSGNCDANNAGLVYVFKNDGTGKFFGAPAPPLLQGSCPNTVSIGDINTDGKPDIITTRGTPTGGDRTLSVATGNGDTTFQPPSSLTYGSSPTNTAVGDFNGDGRLDVAAVDGVGSGNPVVNVAGGNGDGTLDSPHWFTVSYAGLLMHSSQLTSSGQSDIITVSRSGFSVLLSATTGKCVSKVRPSTEAPLPMNSNELIHGLYRMGDKKSDGTVAATVNPTDASANYNYLGGVYANILTCSPWVEPGSDPGTSAWVMLQELHAPNHHMQAGWIEVAGGSPGPQRSTLIELQDSTTVAHANINNISGQGSRKSFERCDDQTSLLAMICAPADQIPTPIPGTSAYYTVEYHPAPARYQTDPSVTFAADDATMRAAVNLSGNNGILCVPTPVFGITFSPPYYTLSYQVRCTISYTTYGSFETYVQQPGKDRVHVASAPARYLPNQANIAGEIHKSFSQMPATAVSPEVFDDAHVYNHVGWVGYGGKEYLTNNQPADAPGPFTILTQGSNDPNLPAGQQILLWDNRIQQIGIL